MYFLRHYTYEAIRKGMNSKPASSYNLGLFNLIFSQKLLKKSKCVRKCYGNRYHLYSILAQGLFSNVCLDTDFSLGLDLSVIMEEDRVCLS